MGQSRTRQRRRDRNRHLPGPKERAGWVPPAVSAEEQLEAKRAADHERQAQRRARVREEREAQEAAAAAAKEAALPGRVDRKGKELADHIRSTYGSHEGAVLQNAVNKRSFAQVREDAGIGAKRVAAAKQVIVDNASDAFRKFGKKGSLPKDQAVAKRASLTVLCSEETVQQNLGRATAQFLGTRRSNVKLGAQRRSAVLTDESLWVLTARKTRSDKLSEEDKALVVRFWTENTRVSPNLKDVRRQWIAPKVYREHITHLLEMTQVG